MLGKREVFPRGKSVEAVPLSVCIPPLLILPFVFNNVFPINDCTSYLFYNLNFSVNSRENKLIKNIKIHFLFESGSPFSLEHVALEIISKTLLFVYTILLNR